MKTTALFVVAGIAAAASAQGVMTISWTMSDTGNGDGILEAGETGVATLWALMEPGATGFAGSIYDLNGDARYADGTHTFDNYLDDLTNDGTDQGNGHVTGIESFQLPAAFNPNFDGSNPIALGQLTYTPNSYAAGVATFSTENHLNFDVYTDDFGTSVSYTGVVTPGAFTIIPAPASMALLGLGGLVAGRRRR
ncbi:MAG TPA: PEP-CTERM sorting domain-containing protein [Phycisphaerales bacterium]|nr:PEP-CTERM sorting domain-containing protein [Phycisphaerales bacterium]